MDLGTKIIGFRAWTIQDDGYLHAIGLTAQGWGRGVNEARCNKNSGLAVSFRYMLDEPPAAPPTPCKDAPGHDCECGLYAYHENKWKVTPGPFVNPAVQVPGVIAAWGRMEVHNTGFRAQKAEIVALGFNPNWVRSTVDRIKAAARDYEVECMPTDRLAAFAAEYGQTIRPEDRPAIPAKKPAEPRTTTTPQEILALMDRQTQRLAELSSQQAFSYSQQISKKRKWF